MLIRSLVGCSEEDARDALNKTGDAVSAIDMLTPQAVLPKGETYVRKPGSFRRTDITEDEAYLNNLRTTMEAMDAEIQEKVTASNQPADLPGVVTQTLHEETVQQNSCEQQCQLPSVEEEAETPETENPLRSESPCDSQ